MSGYDNKPPMGQYPQQMGSPPPPQMGGMPVSSPPPMQHPPSMQSHPSGSGHYPPQGQMPPPGHMVQQYSQGPNVQNQEWTASLCDCSPCESCLLGTFLPCLLLGKTSERIRDPSLQSYEAINSDCLIFSAIQCFTGCGWIYVMMKRGEIRERFGLRGSGCGDCCTTYWCPCCAVIQQDNEVKNRLAAGPVQQGYQPPPPMTMNSP